MTASHLLVTSVAKEAAMAVINKLMDEGIALSVLADPDDGWTILGRISHLKEREQLALTQTFVDAHLGMPRLV